LVGREEESSLAGLCVLEVLKRLSDSIDDSLFFNDPLCPRVEQTFASTKWRRRRDQTQRPQWRRPTQFEVASWDGQYCVQQSCGEVKYTRNRLDDEQIYICQYKQYYPAIMPMYVALFAMRMDCRLGYG
jgi:hypothetical protein